VRAISTRTRITALLAALACCGQPVAAQPNANPETFYRAPSSMSGKTVILPPGTVFEGRIDKSVGSRTSHQGERFTITLSAPVLANGVDVIIPAGSQVIGEVVEAIPSNKLPHQRHTPKPNGKLRVQLTGLKTPDGMTYPLVASIAGESIWAGRRMPNPALGGSVGYMGSAASFEAVAPGMADRARRMAGRAPTVVTRQMMMKDPIYGNANQAGMQRYGAPEIRSLVKRDHDLYIDSGSPLTIKLDAPFKIGVNPVAPGSEVGGPQPAPSGFPEEGSAAGRRFAPAGSPPAGTTSGGTEPAPPGSYNPMEPPASAPTGQPPGPDSAF